MSDEQQGAGAPTEEERARAFREQLKSLHAFDLAYDMMEGLVSFGYQKMGLTDATLELRDLGDARLTIELLRANLEVVERELGEDRTQALHSTLAQMQLGYAQAVQLAGVTPVARPAAAAPAPEDPAAAGPGSPDAASEEVSSAAASDEAPPATKAKPKKASAAKRAAPKKAAPKKPAVKKPRGGGTSAAG